MDYGQADKIGTRRNLIAAAFFTQIIKNTKQVKKLQYTKMVLKPESFKNYPNVEKSQFE